MAMLDRSSAVRCYRGEAEGSKGRETGSREEREAGKLSISCDKAQLIAIFIRIRMHLLRPSRIRHSFTFTCRTTQFEYSASIYICKYCICVCMSVFMHGVYKYIQCYWNKARALTANTHKGRRLPFVSFALICLALLCVLLFTSRILIPQNLHTAQGQKI